MHAGYAVYFPELFPTRLRGTGAGFCFNGARLSAGLLILGAGQLESALKLAPHQTALVVGSLFAAGALALVAAPETKGTELPE
jgi:hypothetical protein